MSCSLIALQTSHPYFSICSFLFSKLNKMAIQTGKYWPLLLKPAILCMNSTEKSLTHIRHLRSCGARIEIPRLNPNLKTYFKFSRNKTHLN